MVAESNVGARLLILGRDGAVSAVRSLTAATAQLNAEIAAGAKASRTAAAGYTEQEAGLASLQAKMAAYETQLGTVRAETDALAKVGKVAFFTMAAAGAAWTYESIKWAQNYQTELVRLRTQAGLTAGAMNQIGAAAMRNSAALGTTPTAYLQAAYHPASTGMSTRQIISITTYAAMASAMSGAPLEDTTNALTGVMKAYGYKGSGLGTVALLNAIVGSGNMRYADLNAALASGVASVGKTFGVSPVSWGGALARLTDIGTPPAQAGTRLRMALALLGGPSAESAKLLTAAGMGQSEQSSRNQAVADALTAAGLTQTQLSGALRNNSGAGGIYNALALLHSHLQGLSPEVQADFISRAFGGGRMGTSIMQLYSNLPALQRKSGQIEGMSSNKRFMSDWAQTTQTLNFQLHRLGGELETIGIAFGKDVLPEVTDVVKVFTDLLGIVGKNKALVVVLGGAVTAVLVPAIGLYLKRALFSNQGAIMGVLNAYKRLILGQTEEQAALARVDASLAVNDDALAGNTAMLRANTGAVVGDETAGLGGGRVGGLAGLGGGLGGKFLGAAGLAGGGLVFGSLVSGNKYTLNGKDSATQQARSVFGSALAGAGIGAGIGSFIGPEGTIIGGGIGAAGGAIYSERHQIGHAITSAWDDLFGGGGSTAPPPRARAHIVAHVTLDGKDITSSTKQNVKKKAARR